MALKGKKEVDDIKEAFVSCGSGGGPGGFSCAGDTEGRSSTGKGYCTRKILAGGVC